MRILQSRLVQLAIAVAAIFVVSQPVCADTQFDILHPFCKDLGCGDGEFPQQSLVRDQAGNLFGTAQGGAHGEGIVYELSPPTTGDKWAYHVLYHFCAKANCVDGLDPSVSTLVVDTAGNVYGVTRAGGEGNAAGAVFRLTPPVTGNRWQFETIYNFCVLFSSCKDGEVPMGGLTYAGREAGLPYDGASPLYGTTSAGGGRFGGVAYSLTPTSNGKWAEKVLYAFCQTGGHACTDGSSPIQRLTMDASGNLYGTTSSGGASNAGVAFKLAPQVGVKRWSETVLDDFCTSCKVVSGLAIDQSGNLFGSSWTGGTSTFCTFTLGCGFIFEIAAGGGVSTIYNFCAQTNCPDGYGPLDQGGLLLDEDGNIFGTARAGGAADEGTLFEFSSGNVQVLHDFCTAKSCRDGALLFAGVIMDADGQLYGASLRRGFHGDGGAVFKFTP